MGSNVGSKSAPRLYWDAGGEDDERAGIPAQTPAAFSHKPIERAAVLGPIKAKPAGGRERRGQP